MEFDLTIIHDIDYYYLMYVLGGAMGVAATLSVYSYINYVIGSSSCSKICTRTCWYLWSNKRAKQFWGRLKRLNGITIDCGIEVFVTKNFIANLWRVSKPRVWSRNDWFVEFCTIIRLRSDHHLLTRLKLNQANYFNSKMQSFDEELFNFHFECIEKRKPMDIEHDWILNGTVYTLKQLNGDWMNEWVSEWVSEWMRDKSIVLNDQITTIGQER